MARALESAAALIEQSPMPQMLSDRYASFDSGKGADFEHGKLSLEELVAYSKKKVNQLKYLVVKNCMKLF